MIKDKVIVVCGGAFNPPTLAHFALYEAAKSIVHMDAFIYVPVADTYPKENLISAQHRFNMLNAMVQGYPQIIIDDIELSQPSFTGTYFTLKALEKKYQARVIYILGTDQVKTLKTWIEAEKLIKNFQFIVIERQEKWQDIKETQPFLKAHHDRFIDVSLDLDIASSDYRLSPDPQLLHPQVHQYIKTHQLYGETL